VAVVWQVFLAAVHRSETAQITLVLRAEGPAVRPAQGIALGT
jgi:hypothetical protein